MKKVVSILFAVVLVLSGASFASAAIGDMPSADALSYGQNAHGCYYISEARDLVYSTDFSLIVNDGFDCNKTLNVNPGVYIPQEVAEWRMAVQSYLQSLAN